MFHRPLVYQGVVRVENKVLVGVCRLPLDGDLVGSISTVTHRSKNGSLPSVSGSVVSWMWSSMLLPPIYGQISP